ncbi:MAG: hypothetical protein ACLGI2_05820 [Acidimicrobiia bacterium]
MGDPSGDGWFGIDELVDRGVVDGMAADLLTQEGRPDVAGSYLGSHLTGPVVARTVAAIVLDRRCPDPCPSNVAVHLHPDSWFDQLWFRTPAAAAVDGDPAGADRACVVLADVALLRTWWAERLVACLVPLLDAVRARLPYGRRGLWGAVADQVAASALTVARQAGLPCRPAWEEAAGLLEALARHAPVAITWPSPFEVRSPRGREAVFPVRGTCCLYYLTVDGPDPCGDGYCITCPFTDPDHRHRTLADRLDEQETGR